MAAARSVGALWAPLLPTVAAVVLEVGGAFQHAMLVCREFGGPAVVAACRAPPGARAASAPASGSP